MPEADRADSIPGRSLCPGWFFPLDFGYHLARMPFEIVLFSEAVSDLRRLSAFERAKVREAIEVHLRHEPTKVSKSRIKRLRELAHPQYRLASMTFGSFMTSRAKRFRSSRSSRKPMRMHGSNR